MPVKFGVAKRDSGWVRSGVLAYRTTVVGPHFAAENPKDGAGELRAITLGKRDNRIGPSFGR